MLSQKQAFPSISSEQNQNIYSYKEKNFNNTFKKEIENKISPGTKFKTHNNNNCYDSSERTFNSKNAKFSKRFDSPDLLNDKENEESIPIEKIKQENNNNNQLKNIKNNKKNKIIEKYKLYIQQLQNFLKSKEEEINSLKKELKKSKLFKKKYFDNLDTGGMGLKILAPMKNICESRQKEKCKYKIQFLDKIEIFDEIKNDNINIETRDSIEILPTIKVPLKAQRVNEMLINSFRPINYIQALDHLTILKDNNLIKDIQIEERDSIEILPNIKAPLKAQKVNQMYIERLEIPEFLIQNLDNMIIIEGNKIENIIQSRDSIEIPSEVKTPLKAQHTENMIINSFQYNKNIRKFLENKELLKTPRNSNYQQLRNSIEHVPLKKSPLQLKNAEDLKNKYLKKYRSENKDYNNYSQEKNEYIKRVNVGNEVDSKFKSNYRYYKFDNVSIKPTLKVQNENTTNLNNHKLEEISYKNKNYNLVTPKPSILPLSKTTKNINTAKYENRRRNNYNNAVTYNNKEYINSNYSTRKSRIIENTKNINNENVQNIKGRNVKVIRTQKNGPSIIEKKFVAHSCEKSNNYLNFKKNK